MSIDGADTLLRGWTIELPSRAATPVRLAAATLRQFGAREADGVAGDPSTVRLAAAGGRRVRAGLRGWVGEEALPVGPPHGSVLTAYAGLRLAGAAAFAARRGIDLELRTEQLRRELTAPVNLSGGGGPELFRCRDGWVVVRWREEGERPLLRALVGDEGESTRADVVAAARTARILAAPVLPPLDRRGRFDLGHGAIVGDHAALNRRPRVLDWSVLWAGPWATGELRRTGSAVQRLEHPRRRDGLLGSPEGRRWWRRLNGHKRIVLLDAARAGEHKRLAGSIREADILVTSMTPRALRSLGFDDDWRAEHAPRLLHLELVAFEEPWSDAPGLGEHAAAQAGLLWNHDEAMPAPPLPWADPLLGAAALALAQIWLAAATPRGGRVRLSLEQAAALALAAGPGLGPRSAPPHERARRALRASTPAR